MLYKVSREFCNLRPAEIKGFIADTVIGTAYSKLHTFRIMVNHKDIAVSCMTACTIFISQEVSKFLICRIVIFKKFRNAKLATLKTTATHDLLVQFLKTIHLGNGFAVLDRGNSLFRCRRIDQFRFSEQGQLFILLFCISKRFEFLIRNKTKTCLSDHTLIEKRCIVGNLCFFRFFCDRFIFHKFLFRVDKLNICNFGFNQIPTLNILISHFHSFLGVFRLTTHWGIRTAFLIIDKNIVCFEV